MLNELLVMERGTRHAGIEVSQPHSTIKDCKDVPTLRIDFSEAGRIARVSLVPEGVRLWTLRDGQQNSFPFVQPKPPLLQIGWSKRLAIIASNRKHPRRRDALLRLFRRYSLNQKAASATLTPSLLVRTCQRAVTLRRGGGDAVVTVIDAAERLIKAADDPTYGIIELFRDITRALDQQLRQTVDYNWVEAAAALALSKWNPKKEEWIGAGGLLFAASGQYPVDIADANLRHRVSASLYSAEEKERAVKSAEAPETASGFRCGLTGRDGTRATAFQEPSLPSLGQMKLYAKNKHIPCLGRYRRIDSDAMPVAEAVISSLAGTVTALTSGEREGKTWRSVPGERPKPPDLLVAFVEVAPDAPIADMVAMEDGLDEEDHAERGDSIAAFETRTQRLLDAVQAKAADLTQTPVRYAIFRKLDLGNRKVIYGGETSVTNLRDAAYAWRDGERNLPAWLTLPGFTKGEKTPPPHVAPLGLIAFSRGLYTHGGTKRQEATGLPASEAFALFLDPHDNRRSRRRAELVLRLVMTRRDALAASTVHGLRKGLKHATKHDRREALRTATVVGVLLYKLGREKDRYMNDAAFKLGQLLSAADQVHAGYCADVRGGDVPPSLLGNQVFTMAQTAPAKALATLCRRWKPYDGWAKKAARDRGASDALVNSKNMRDQQRGWDIRKAISQARRAGLLAQELAPALAEARADELFRAELLLGYMAGLDPKQRDSESSNTPEIDSTEQETKHA